MTVLKSRQSRPEIDANDRLSFTLFLALSIHTIIVLGIDFTRAQLPNQSISPNLGIILTNPHSPEPINRNKYRDTEQEQHSNMLFNQPQFGPVVFLSQRKSDISILSKKQSSDFLQSTTKQKFEQNYSQIAELQAEIRQMSVDYAKKPRVMTLTASTEKSVEADYLAAWVSKVENTGNQNYPTEAHIKKLSGQLRMSVRLNASGEVIEYKITHSSGNHVLDEAAKHILRLAEPFPVFPEEMKKRTDHIVIIRTWNFSTSQLRTNNGNS